MKYLRLADKDRLQSVLLGYQKVKGEMDQFREGLEALGVLKSLSFTHERFHKLSAGRCMCPCLLIHVYVTVYAEIGHMSAKLILRYSVGSERLA